MTGIAIRTAQRHHLKALRAIEIAAFETLRSAGAVEGPAVASSIDDFRRLCREGVLLVALSENETPVGFAAGRIVDNELHIAEADVHPDWQRKGIGRQLMEALLAEGRKRCLRGASLTTDRFAPFNARFYASLGFNMIDEAELSPRLSALLTAEAKGGLDPDRRVAMQLWF